MGQGPRMSVAEGGWYSPLRRRRGVFSSDLVGDMLGWCVGMGASCSLYQRMEREGRR